jgi:enamine deaminase RidA (YjgF/YER057c/UK114 family)
MTSFDKRRAFLKQSFFLSVGAAAGSLATWGSRGNGAAPAGESQATGSAEKRLQELGIVLPPAPKPVAVYVPAVKVGDVLYASGHGPRKSDGDLIEGKVGSDLNLDEGKAAARLVGLNMLSTVRAALGSLDHVVRLVKVLGMVNCVADFDQHPQVINGFSELMVEVFGEQAGKAARSAVGMGSLPGNIPVEIEAIFQVRL